MQVKLLRSTPDPEEAVCLAARNDYFPGWIGDEEFEDVLKVSKGDTTEEKMKSLITHLITHGHYGPFEHVNFTFSVEGMSRSCMAQITRHRHASFDVQSARYVRYEDENIVRPPSIDSAEIGRNSDPMEEMKGWNDKAVAKLRGEAFDKAIKESFKQYRALLDYGVAPEDARFVLPVATRVNVVFTMNFRSLLHLADMRAAADAQWEIRELTEAILSTVEAECPITMGYWNANMKGRKNRLAP